MSLSAEIDWLILSFRTAITFIGSYMGQVLRYTEERGGSWQLGDPGERDVNNFNDCEVFSRNSALELRRTPYSCDYKAWQNQVEKEQGRRPITNLSNKIIHSVYFF